MISPVDEIKERLNIVDIIQEYVPLKKAGANHKGKCPFHNENTPSFTVSESKQFFHCFGCGKGGDIFTFIQEIEGAEFPEVLRMLAQRAQVELRPMQTGAQHTERSAILDCLQEAAAFYHHALLTSPEAERARIYTKERGVTEETMQTFQLGYSMSDWDALLKHLHKKEYKDRDIERAGLSVRSQKTGSFYDRFRGRLIFPIYHAHGHVIGFGGRTLDPEQKEAKYINSPQTEVYNKSAVLYGLHLAKKYIQKMDATVVVEGYMDVITAHQAKFRNVVAASGTALTDDQLRILKRYSTNIILAFDADAAGLSAAWRGMQAAIRQGMNIKILVLPAGQDPDDLIRTSPEEFRTRAIAAKPFMEYAVDTVLAPLDLSNIHHKKKAAAELLPMIAQFPDPMEREHYLRMIAARLAVSAQVLEEKVRQMQSAAQRSTQKPIAAQPTSQKKHVPTVTSRSDLLSDRLLALLTLHPEFIEEMQERTPEIPALFADTKEELYRFLESQYNHGTSIDLAKEDFPSENVWNAWQRFQLLAEEIYYNYSAEQQQNEAFTLLESLERERIKGRLKTVEQELAAAESNHHAIAIQQLSEEFRALTELLRKSG